MCVCVCVCVCVVGGSQLLSVHGGCGTIIHVFVLFYFVVFMFFVKMIIQILVN